MNKKYRPMPIKRVYVPEPNGEHSYGFLLKRSVDMAMEEVLNHLNEG